MEISEEREVPRRPRVEEEDEDENAEPKLKCRKYTRALVLGLLAIFLALGFRYHFWYLAIINAQITSLYLNDFILPLIEQDQLTAPIFWISLSFVLQLLLFAMSDCWPWGIFHPEMVIPFSWWLLLVLDKWKPFLTCVHDLDDKILTKFMASRFNKFPADTCAEKFVHTIFHRGSITVVFFIWCLIIYMAVGLIYSRAKLLHTFDEIFDFADLQRRPFSFMYDKNCTNTNRTI